MNTLCTLTALSGPLLLTSRLILPLLHLLLVVVVVVLRLGILQFTHVIQVLCQGLGGRRSRRSYSCVHGRIQMTRKKRKTWN
jgi:hypothetical protein